jgi:ankyrin repeat domain-containing protein 11/12
MIKCLFYFHRLENPQEAMIIRHTNEAESLNAVQKMDWGWKMKEFSLCEYKANPEIEELFVPMIDVSDEIYCATRETY